MKKCLQSSAFFVWLICSIPAHAATWALVQHASTSNCGSPCTLTLTQNTTAGNIGIITTGFTSTGKTISAISGGGTWIHPTCSGSGSGNGHSVDVWYILSLTGGVGSIQTTSSATQDFLEFTEYSNPNGGAFDVCAMRNAASGTNLAGTSAGVLGGSNDVILQFAVMGGTASGCPNSAASPADFPNGDAACGLINSTNNAAGNYTNTAGSAAMGSIAIKEASGGGTSVSPTNKRRRYDLVDEL
jgi:hypothetical protein